MDKSSWQGPVFSRMHSDFELYPPDSSRVYRQYDLGDPDLALIRESGIELTRHGSLDLGEELLLLSERLSPDDFRVHLGLAIAHIQRITDMSKSGNYRVSGICIMESINGEWVPMSDYTEYEQQCEAHLDRAIQLAPKNMKKSLIVFRDKCLE